MNRLVAILLMPFLVVGNSLAHSHGVAALQSPSEGRAHFHFVSAHQQAHNHDAHEHGAHGHSQSGHSDDQDHENDDSKLAPVEQPIDHDSHAVYIAAPDFMITMSDRNLIETGWFGFLETVEDYSAGIRRSPRHDVRRLATTTELPLYLLHAALRL